MTIDERMRLSFYKEISSLNEEHGVSVVQHIETHSFYLKKELTNYQLDIFLRLKENPVPNMPRIIEAVEDNDRLIVIESYLSGETLRQRLEKDGVFPTQRIRSIGIQLCDILKDLHAMGIVHRDIKPENIIYEEPGIIKLLDLDAAKFYKPGENRDTQLIGTREYAAPEQYGFGASSPETDIYAIGVLLNVLATGQYPRIALTTDMGLRSIIQRCIRLDPRERYTSVYDLKRALSNQTIKPLNRMPIEGSAQGNYTAPVRRSGQSNYDPVIPKEPAEKISDRKGFTDYFMNSGSGWRRFLLPGFRSGQFLHILLAVIWYYFGFYTAVKSIIEPDSSLTRAEIGLTAYRYFVLAIILPCVMCNYCGILDKVKITRIKSSIIRLALAWMLTIVVYGIFYEVGTLVMRLTGNL